MAQQDVIEAVVGALGIGVFVETPEGRFESVGPVPAWMAAFGRDPTFPFLGSFLEQARRHWESPQATCLTWGPCAEVDQDGREFHYTVSALALPVGRVLVFELDLQAGQMRDLLQRVRTEALTAATAPPSPAGDEDTSPGLPRRA